MPANRASATRAIVCQRRSRPLRFAARAIEAGCSRRSSVWAWPISPTARPVALRWRSATCQPGAGPGDRATVAAADEPAAGLDAEARRILLRRPRARARRPGHDCGACVASGRGGLGLADMVAILLNGAVRSRRPGLHRPAPGRRDVARGRRPDRAAVHIDPRARRSSVALARSSVDRWPGAATLAAWAAAIRIGKLGTAPLHATVHGSAPCWNAGTSFSRRARCCTPGHRSTKSRPGSANVVVHVEPARAVVIANPREDRRSINSRRKEFGDDVA